MGYKNGKKLLPASLVAEIQKYVDGENIYIPRKEENHKYWGDNTDTKVILDIRNKEIYDKYIKGYRVVDLAKEYHISTQAVYKILSNIKKNNQ